MKKITTRISALASMLVMILFLAPTISQAQVSNDSITMQNCIMMRDGKMLKMEDGKLTEMGKVATMKNGTKVKMNGEYTLSDGTKKTLKEGECMYMDGMVAQCGMMHHDVSPAEKTNGNQASNNHMYRCAKDADIYSVEPGRCPKCRSELYLKK